MNFKFILRYVLIFMFSLFVFVGCGSSNSSNDSKSDESPATTATDNSGNTTEEETTTEDVVKTKGYLIDSPVEGVHYFCADGADGLTNVEGMFECEKAPVTFKVGGLTLGVLESFTSDSKVYLHDLLGLARTNFTDAKLKLLARLVQSLDDDGNIENTITITQSVRDALTVEQDFKNMSESDVDALVRGLGKSFVLECGALEHLGDDGLSCASDGSYEVVIPSSGSSKTTITGYAEDDPMPNAKIRVTDEANNLLVETIADANGKYTLQANFVNGKVYTLESKGKLGDRNITMHSIFKFDKDTIVNVNPITEITYLLSQETNLTLEVINLKVLSYFGITDYSEAKKIRFLNVSKAYEGMKTFSKSEVPIDAVDAFKSDIKDDLTNLRLLILDDLKIIPSLESTEVSNTITFSLNKEFTSDYKITWAGIDRDSDMPQLTSTYAGNRGVAVKVTYNNKTILTDSISVNFYKIGLKESIAIADNNVEQNTTVNDITVTIPKNSLPSGVSNIFITEIDKGTSNVLKTLKLEPSGTIFNMPLSIRVPYDLSTIDDPSKLFIERLEEDGSVEILKPTIDYKQNELVFQTDHFSTFTIKIDSDGRKFVNDSYFDDIEDKLFITDGEYSISLSDLDDTNMYELIKDAVYGDYLNADTKEIVNEFYNEGYDLELDGFDSNYEKAFRYVLAEPILKSDEYDYDEPNIAQKMIKYELLVDSLKKYRVAKLIDAYIKNDMLVEPYEYLFYGDVTREDFFNEIIKVEKESYGLIDDKAFKIHSNVAYDVYQTMKGTKDFLTATATNIVEYGYSATGTKLAWDVVVNDFKETVKQELTQYLTNERFTYLECFDVNLEYDYREYKMGDTAILTIHNDGSIEEKGYLVQELGEIFYGTANLDTLESKLKNFSANNDISINTNSASNIYSCILNKLEKKTESNYSTIETARIIFESNTVHNLFISLAKSLSNNNINKYTDILKIIHFNKEELEEYSKYLKTLAIANTAPIIADIVVEANLIDGESIQDIEDDKFFINDTAKQEAIVKFNKYKDTSYDKMSSKSSINSIYRKVEKTESSDKINVYGLETFKNLKLRIDKKYMDNFSLDVVKLNINYISLEKKIATDGITGNYYETIDVSKELNLKNIDIKLDDYTFNTSTNKYEISLEKLFSSMDISEIAYLDVKLSILFIYNGKPYHIEKTFDFVADSNPNELLIDEVEKGSFTVLVKDKLNNPLNKVEVSIADKKCITNTIGECTIENLIPSEYKISLIKDGYFPEYKDSFIDVASTKKVEFSLKEYDTTAEILLDVVEVRSEVNPMEYKFYINALGSNLDLNISFGDGTELTGSLRYLLGDDNYITHKYTSKGLKTVNVKIMNETNSLEKTLNTYPIDSDQIVDVVFLVDLSGSYGSSLSNFQSKAIEIANGFATLGSDTRVGLASFDEFPSYADSDDFAYAQNKELTYDFDAFNYAVNQMELKWGGDGPESQLEGLYQVSKTFNWQDKSEKYIFLATDASFHNSDIEVGYPGPGYVKTLEALKEKNIKVIGLNRGGSNIADVTSVTNDTGGTIFYLDSSSSDIVDRIMEFSETSKTSKSIFYEKTVERVVGSIIQGNSN